MERHTNILVIDDEPDNFDVIETLLLSEGFQLNYVSDGRRALDRINDIQPDVILLDVMMPDMDGIEFCQRFKANPKWRSIPIIMVTALSSKEDLARCLAAGADDFISKPVSGAELRARVRSMLRIKQQHDALQEALQLRTDLSNMVVHDLRNPLTSIGLAAEMLQRPDLPPDFQLRKMNQIVTASQQLQSMVDSLLLLAKMESGRMTLQRTAVDLHTMCSAAVADLEAIAAQKNLELISELPEPGSSIELDAIVFRRILDNLLTNAIKFAPLDSSIIVRATYLAPERARLQVVDMGPGVSQTLQNNIFEKFEVGTLMQDIPQVGLGLAFCKMAVEAHGGYIQVEPNQPKGAIFTIDV